MTEQPGAPTPPPAPPGWYPHPNLPEQRYWDGHDWTDFVAPLAVAQPRRTGRPRKAALITFTVLAAVGTLVAVLLLLDYNSGENKARRACHDYVEASLKAPSTASFSSESARKQGNVYIATGIVDSENGFGAKIRNVFTCTVDSNFVVEKTHFSEDDQ